MENQNEFAKEDGEKVESLPKPDLIDFVPIRPIPGPSFPLKPIQADLED